VISAAFYFGTVGVLARSTDTKLLSIANKLTAHFDMRGGDQLRQEIEQLLADGIEQDTPKSISLSRRTDEKSPATSLAGRLQPRRPTALRT
jgi:hypothetical protein